MRHMTEEKKDVTFKINGQSVTVPKGTTVYQAATQLGIDIPIFCYQDRMPPFGACRMCLVQVDKMAKLQTSCTLVATEGMEVKTDSEGAAKGREEILELLLINHPLDCPICDKGGECPLQDQAVKFGPERSQFYEKKRHFEKPYALGPVLMLDRERCIICARCTRFSDLVSGDNALEFVERGYKTEVGTPGGGPVESKFIGNTISICPVGALTSRVYRFKARPWDNKHTETTCTLCPVGCSMTLDSRDGEVMRTRSCENRAVNDIWLCDKGWFGYEFADSPDRLKQPLIKRNGKFVPASWDEAIALIASKIHESKASGKIAGWGGKNLTVEENYLFQRLMRETAGTENLDYRIGETIFSLDQEGIPPGMEISIQECEDLTTTLLLGVNLTEEFPVIWLRIKHALNNNGKAYFAGHYAPEIKKHLTECLLHSPGKELEILKQKKNEWCDLFKQGKKCALFIGSQYLNSPDRLKILTELISWKKEIPSLSLNILEGRGNSEGARLAGMHPDLGPLGVKKEHSGLNASQVLEEAAANGWGLLYIAGVDPALKFPKKIWDEARSKTGFVVVQDLFLTKTAAEADVVLPTLCYLEKEGTFLNIEKRPQKLRIGKVIPEGVLSDADIFMLLGRRLNHSLHVDKAFVEALHSSGAKRPITKTLDIGNTSIKPHKEGSLRASFATYLFDHGVRMKHNKHLIQVAKEPFVLIHPEEGKRRGVKCGDRVAIKSGGNEIEAKVKLDKMVSEGTVVLPLGFDEVPVQNLGIELLNGMEIELYVI